jgi:DNA-binding NarL/FixJ family response regulator
MVIKLALADDHPMVIKGLQSIFGVYPQIEVCGVYPNGNLLMEGLAKTKPDVVLLDICMPGIEGTELAPLIHNQYPDVRILVITNLDQTYYLQTMMQHGASGYLLKNTDADTLVAAIEAVHSGGQFIDPLMKDKMVKEMFASDKAKAIPMLGYREKEVLTLIAQECTSQEIAEKLFISQRTVDYHRLNLLFKFDVKNSVGLVRRAIELKFI